MASYNQPTSPHFRKKDAAPPDIPEKIGPYKIEALLERGA